MQQLNFIRIFSAVVLVSHLLLVDGLTGQTFAAESPASKKTIAIVEFAVRGDGLDPQAGAIIADSLTSAIANIGSFALKDRISLSAIAKLAKKNPLGSIGPVDSETAIQLGTLYGIYGVVTGTISKLGDRVMVTARLIDTQTGTVLRSGEIQGKDIDAVQIKLDNLAMLITGAAAATVTQDLHALTVKTEPTNAAIRLLNFSQPYQPGLRLPSGIYEIEVSCPGYVTQKANAKIVENDVNLLVSLEKALYALTIDVDPPQSKISILNIQKPYQPGIKLESGAYQIEIAYPGYQTKRKNITIVDADLNIVLNLEAQSGATPANPAPTPVINAPVASTIPRYRLTIHVDPPEATVHFRNNPTLYQPGVALAPGRYEINIRSSGYQSKQFSVSITDHDLIIPVVLQKKPVRATHPSSARNNDLRHNSTSASRDQTVKSPPPPKENAFKRGFRNFRDDFKKAFW